MGLWLGLGVLLREEDGAHRDAVRLSAIIKLAVIILSLKEKGSANLKRM